MIENQEEKKPKKKIRTSVIVLLVILLVSSIKIEPNNTSNKKPELTNEEIKSRDVAKYDNYHPSENSYVYIIDKDYYSYIDLNTKLKDNILVKKVTYKNGKIYYKECFDKKFIKISETEYQLKGMMIIINNPEIDIDFINDEDTYTYSRVGNISKDITNLNINEYLHSKSSIGDLININATYKSTIVSNRKIFNIFEAKDGTTFYVFGSQSDPNFIKNNYVRIIGSLYEINDDDIPVLHSLSITILK